MIKVTVRFDFRDLHRMTNVIAAFPVVTAIPNVGAELIPWIRSQSKKGIDANDEAFEAYTDKYAAKRDKMGLPTSPVDLTVSGDYLASLHRDASGNVTVADKFQKQAEGLTKKRVHIGVSPSFVRTMEMKIPIIALRTIR